jgi:hypothetical protein
MESQLFVLWLSRSVSEGEEKPKKGWWRRRKLREGETNRGRDATQGSSYEFDLVHARSLVRPMELNLYMGWKWV